MAMAYEMSGQANASVKPTTLQSVVEGLDPLLGQLEQILQRASMIGDRINGARPAEVSATKDAPEPNHLIWMAAARRERLSRLVDQLGNEISRIESGLA